DEQATFSDYCTATADLDITMTSSTTQDPDCPNAYVIERSWYAKDESGNISDTVNQIITVIDDTPASITYVPADITLQCYDASGIADAQAEQATFSDNCTATDDLDITMTSSTTPDPDCPNAYVIEKSWQAEDGCGNFSQTVTQVITVIDDMPPVVTYVPADITLQCDDAAGIAAAQAQQATFIDNCTAEDDLDITMTSSTTQD